MRSLEETRTDHRPWQMPAAPWVVFMCWRDLLFAHWPVRADKLQSLLPPGLKLDTWDGQGWIGIVPFRMTDVGPRLMPPIPGVSSFSELNVRTYVTVGGKPGVWFFSLDADSTVAVRAARWGLNLPYRDATFRISDTSDGGVEYRCDRTPSAAGDAEFEATYRPVAPVTEAVSGSLEYWFIERYCLYTLLAGHLLRLDIHHNPWPIQEAEADITRNTMTKPLGFPVIGQPQLHFARKQDVFSWAPTPAS